MSDSGLQSVEQKCSLAPESIPILCQYMFLSQALREAMGCLLLNNYSPLAQCHRLLLFLSPWTSRWAPALTPPLQQHPPARLVSFHHFSSSPFKTHERLGNPVNSMPWHKPLSLLPPSQCCPCPANLSRVAGPPTQGPSRGQFFSLGEPGPRAPSRARCSLN